ncbi:MAG TPA: hypothetical protein PLV25_07770, partial [Opitutales bacterium]|nr:hypothetical protein [Opitutales bacterium]
KEHDLLFKKLQGFMHTLLELNVRLDNADSDLETESECLLKSIERLELFQSVTLSILERRSLQDFAQNRKNSRLQYYSRVIAFYQRMLQEYDCDDTQIQYLNEGIRSAEAERFRLIMDQPLAPVRLDAQAPQQTNPRKRRRVEEPLIRHIHRSRKARATGINHNRQVFCAENPIDEDDRPEPIIATTTTTTTTPQEVLTLADFLDTIALGGNRFIAKDSQPPLT